MARPVFTLRPILVLALACAALCAAPLAGGPGTEAAAQGEYVKTYADDCATPQTVFYFGDTVCAELGDLPLPPGSSSRFRRFQWSTPDASVAAMTTVKVDPQFTKFIIPSSGALAQAGVWHVRSVSSSAEGFASTKFTVRDPLRRWADLWLHKLGVIKALPGEQLRYTLGIGNPGPDYAEGVTFVAEVPNDMLFMALRQTSGDFFECSTPQRGGTGRIICKGKALGPGEKAEFLVYYQVNPDAREGTVCTGRSYVTSGTEELRKEDNDWNTEVTVVGPEREGEGEPEP